MLGTFTYIVYTDEIISTFSPNFFIMWGFSKEKHGLWNQKDQGSNT